MNFARFPRYFSSLALLAMMGFSHHAQSAPTPLTDINYIPSVGQSLSVGWTANPVVSTEQPFKNIMFAGGVRPYETGNDKSRFVPLVESTSPPNGPRGETPVSGAAEFFIRFLKTSNSPLAGKTQILGAANGIGGVSITALVKGTGPYQNILDDLEQGKKLAGMEKKTFSMPGFIWTQGETDQQDKKEKDWYKQQMTTLIRDLNQDAKKITGQKNDLYCFGYQVGSHLNYHAQNPTDYATIAIAQLELALDPESRYIMTTPMYHLTYSDGVHLTAPMSKLYGAHIGYVMKQVLADGKKWLPIHPVSHKIVKRGTQWAIYVKFHTPVAPLVLDTEAISDPGNYGFSLIGEDGTEKTISSVEVTSPGVICITTADNPSKAHIRYGMTLNAKLPSGPRTGARGCLRDSQGNTVTATIDGENHRLDNWCPFFDYDLAGKNNH